MSPTSPDRAFDQDQTSRVALGSSGFGHETLFHRRRAFELVYSQSHMSNDGTGRGRPRGFDTDEILDQSVDVFWKRGLSGATSRALEQDLGISQSSLYNAFESKEELLSRAIERYGEALDSEVLTHLDTDDADRASLHRFLDAVTEWVSDDNHRGCLLLNLATESSDGAQRAKLYRTRLRRLVGGAVRSFATDPTTVTARTEVIVSAVLGLNITARSGASKNELRRLRDGVKHQIQAW